MSAGGSCSLARQSYQSCLGSALLDKKGVGEGVGGTPGRIPTSPNHNTWNAGNADMAALVDHRLVRVWVVHGTIAVPIVGDERHFDHAQKIQLISLWCFLRHSRRPPHFLPLSCSCHRLLLGLKWRRGG